MDARDVVERMQGSYTGGELDGSLLAEDIVCEWPFAAPGRPKRLVGRDALLTMAKAARAAMPFTLDGVRVDAVHETQDPEVVIVELELSGSVNATGERRTAAMVVVFRVCEGEIGPMAGISGHVRNK